MSQKRREGKRVEVGCHEKERKGRRREGFLRRKKEEEFVC